MGGSAGAEGTTLGRRAARGGAVVIGAQAAEVFIRLLGLLALGALVSPRAFGVVAAATVVVVGWGALSTVGLGEIVRTYNTSVRDDRLSLAVALVLGGASAALAAALALPLVELLQAPDALPVVFVLVPLLVSHQVRVVLEGRVERLFQFRRAATIRVVGALVGAVVAVISALANAQEWALVIQLVVGELVILVGLLAVTSPGARRPLFEPRGMRRVLIEGRQFWGAGVIVFFYTNSDDAVVSRYLGQVSLGLYSFAFRLANLPVQILSHSLARVLLPSLRRLRTSDAGISSAFLRTLRWMAWSGGVSGVAIAVLGPNLLTIVYGERWVGAYPALRVLGVYGAVRVLGGLTGSVFVACDRPDLVRKVAQWQTLGMLILVVPMSRGMEIVGAAVAVSLPLVLAVLVAVDLSARLAEVRRTEVAGTLVPIWGALAAAGGIAAIVGSWTDTPGGALTVSAAFLSVVALVVAGWRLRQDATFIRAVLKRHDRP